MEDRNRKKKGRKGGIIAAVIVALVVIAAAVCWFMGLVGGISEAEAEAAAREQVAEATMADSVYTVKEFDDGMMKYDVQLIHDDMMYEFEILARNGRVISCDTERIGNSSVNNNGNAVNNQNTSNTDSAAGTGDIGMEKAQEIAIANVAGASTGDIVKSKLDSEHGKPVYEIEIVYEGTEYDFEIDAATGDVISHDMDRH